LTIKKDLKHEEIFFEVLSRFYEKEYQEESFLHLSMTT